MTVQPTRDQLEDELDSWMARAYEAEKRAWQAEARIRAVRELHHKETRDGIDVCEHCDLLGDRLYIGGVWPCDTIRALESVPPPSA